MMVIDKNDLRELHRGIRNAIPQEMREQKSWQILNNITNSNFYKNCESIMLYSSIGSEVDTAALIKQCFKDKKTLSLPRCDTKIKEMKAYIIESLNDLKTGTYGILEPKVNNICECPQVIIIPALAIDVNGNRIGYGAGYYDRFLSIRPDVFKIGVVFSENYIKIPNTWHISEHDVAVDAVVTDEGIFCRKTL